MRPRHRLPLLPCLLALCIAGCAGAGSVGSDAPQVTPGATTVPPRGSVTLVASGGRTPYAWSLRAPSSAGARVDADGTYHAGPTAGASDVVLATDAGGQAGQATVTVGAGVTLAPPHAVVSPGGQQNFVASGGSGAGFTFAVTSAAATGTINAAGLYQAGSIGPGDEVVTATDSLGNTATATVHVRGALAITPLFSAVKAGDAVTFQVTGAAGQVTYKLSSALSGGAVDAGGRYQAGGASGVDVIRVTDEAGDQGAAAVQVLGAPEQGFPIARHPIQRIDNAGGPVLTRPTLVTIVWASDPNRAAIAAFGGYLAASDWLVQVGAEYGLEAAGHVHVEVPGSAPARITDGQLQADIADWMDAGTVPTNADGQHLYMAFLPRSTTLTFGGSSLCEFSGGGYHFDAQANDGTPFAYAVVSPCPEQGFSALEVIGEAGSHELIEAITDPFPATDPAWRTSNDPTDPWSFIGGETGDLCSYSGDYQAGGYRLTQVFSPAAAAAGASPCVPSRSPFYTVAASPATMQSVPAGGRVVYTLTGWSTQDIGTWSLYTAVMGAGGFAPFNPDVQLRSTDIGNGLSTTMTVTVPFGTPSGSGALIFVGSARSQTDYTGTVVGLTTR